MPGAARVEKLKASIVVATADADSHSAVVERDERRQHEIEVRKVARQRAGRQHQGAAQGVLIGVGFRPQAAMQYLAGEQAGNGVAKIIHVGMLQN